MSKPAGRAPAKPKPMPRNTPKTAVKVTPKPSAKAAKPAGATKKAEEGTVSRDNFEFGPIVARDAISNVYRVVSKKTGKVFAIKQIQKASRSVDSDSKISPKWLCKVKHPNIANYTKYFIDDGNIDLVAEFCDLGSFTDVIRAMKRPLNELETAVVLKIVLGALAAVHATGVCHGDIKASNVLLSSNGTVKVGDFMIRAWTKPTFTWWHAHWMAPEVMEAGVRGDETKADIWSVGVLAIELLVGKQPYSDYGEMVAKMQIRRGNFPEPPATASPEFKHFVGRVFSGDPDKRPTAEALLKDQFLKSVDDTITKDVLTGIVHACKGVPRKEMKEFEFDYDDEEEEEEEAHEDTPKDAPEQ